MAGLTAARILADHFAQVTIIDRDQFPLEPTHRAGVPQARHLHALLTRGYRLLDGRFPTLFDELTAAGALRAEWGHDSRVSLFGRWMPVIRSGLMTVLCSRDLLEYTVRRLLMAHQNVELIAGHEVVGLVTSAPGGFVQGVRTRARTQGSTPPEPMPVAFPGDRDRENVIAADFTVDASGRGSHTPEWLSALGYPAAAETVITPFLRYASRLYAAPTAFSEQWKSLLVRGVGPRVHRGGIIFRIEGGRWLVTLAGANRDYPQLDPDGFLEFARTLGDPPVLHANC
jgi:flavin-dependent dehydrogenase